jgi:hypothetical protein
MTQYKKDMCKNNIIIRDDGFEQQQTLRHLCHQTSDFGSVE